MEAMINGADLMADSSPPMRSWTRKAMCGVRRLKKALEEDFPPFLSTLDNNGRPRFNLIKVRRNGRLVMAMVRNDKPVIARSYEKDGSGLRMEMVMVKCEEEYYHKESHSEEVEE